MDIITDGGNNTKTPALSKLCPANLEGFVPTFTQGIEQTSRIQGERQVMTLGEGFKGNSDGSQEAL